MTSERGGMAAGGMWGTDAWRGAMEATIAGYGAQWRQLLELGRLWGLPTPDSEQTREGLARLTAAVSAVMEAQGAVASEALRMPFWLTGAASAADLQAAYARLLAAQAELFGAYFDLALGWQRAQAGTAGRAVEAGQDVRGAALDATGAGLRAAQETAARAGAAAGRVAEERAEQAERDRRRAEREREQERERERERAEAAAAEERERRREERAREREERERFERAAREIKGNINREGEKIYHLPGQPGYERVQAEELFATEEEAQAAGYRRSQAPGGGAIKGVVRGGERIYHLPGQASYDRIEEPDMLFESEEQAEANGFRPAQR